MLYKYGEMSHEKRLASLPPKERIAYIQGFREGADMIRRRYARETEAVEEFLRVQEASWQAEIGATLKEIERER